MFFKDKMTLNLLKLNMTPFTFDPIFGSVQVTLIVLNNQFFTFILEDSAELAMQTTTITEM